MRLLYGWRLTNWLMAKPWTWNYRAIYRSLRTPSARWPERYPGEGRLRALWHAATFPHVHAPWED